MKSLKSIFSFFNKKKKNKEAKKNRIKIKYLSRVLSKQEKIIVLGLLIFSTISLSWILFKVYADHVDIKPDHGGQLIEGMVGEPQYINPLLSSANDIDMDISSIVFSGLMKYNLNQELVPDIAESYEVSEDNKEYTFKIRQDIKWHDGESLSADDIVFTVQTIKNPDYQSSYLPNFENITIEKIDDHTIKFTLTGEALSPFIKENTTFGIIPKHIWQEISPNKSLLSNYNLNPIGSGPYQFKEFKKDKRNGMMVSYSLERNKNFYDGSPYIDNIIFKFYNDYPELINALNKEDIDNISFIPSEELDNIKSDIKENIFFYNLKLPRYYALFFNQPKNELLGNKELRQALAYGTNKQEIIDKVFGGQGVKIDSPILNNFLDYNPEIKKYEFNKEKANKLLHNAGYDEINENGIRQKGDKKLELIITTTNQKEFSELAQMLKDQWKEIGIDVKIESLDPTELQTDYLRPRNYQILLYGQLLGHDPDPYPFWHSSQRSNPGLNLTSFKDNTADDLLETARKNNIEEERKTKYIHFQNIIAEELPALFICSPTYPYGLNKKIRGVELDFITVPSDRFTNIKNWFIEINRRWK